MLAYYLAFPSGTLWNQFVTYWIEVSTIFQDKCVVLYTLLACIFIIYCARKNDSTVYGGDYEQGTFLGP